MFSRRSFFLSTAAAASLAATSATRAEECLYFTPDRQKATTPEAALQLLKDGNARFVSGKTINCDLLKQALAGGTGQAPHAMIVGCIDSRAPPELVFDQRIGDIFVARIAGNFVNDDIVASVEYATKVAGAKAIVVLGHSDCGAIKAGVDGAKLGLITKMLENFNPAIEATRGFEGERTTKNKKFVQAVADMNAVLTAKKLTERSEILRDLVAQKQLVIAAGMRDIGTGVVTFLT